ncbi:MAG: RIP metalloprotease RseP [Cyanothece sp. SIO2G6]|nr:RIP metalloprotease RseP [Cyanothece sp. SIO2G6]
MSVLAAIAVLALLIVVHEAGHFMAARLQGIHVNRFSVGFGPILWKYQGTETEYALRAIPLGGFVGFPDDDPDSNIPAHDPDLMKNRPVLDRAIVISAGVIANLIFAYLIFVVEFAGLGIPEEHYDPGVVIADVMAVDSPAAQAGLQANDLVIAVNGTTLATGTPAMDELQQVIKRSPNQSVSLTIERERQRSVIQVVPRSANNDGVARIGVGLQANGGVVKGENGLALRRRPNSVSEILRVSALEFQALVSMTVKGFVTLVTNFSEMSGQVAGPVRIVEQGAQFAKTDLSYLFPFTAIISINLAIINILPLPALDGGQLAFLMVEAMRGRPLPMRLQENVMQTGLFLILGLGIFLIVRDTTQLEVVQNLFQ